MQRNLKASWTFYSYCQGSVKNKVVFIQELYCSSTCVVVWPMNAAPSWAASSWKCLHWPLGAGAQSNPREGNGGEGFECDTNRKLWVWVFFQLSGAHKRFTQKFCTCASCFAELSNTICIAKSLHKTHLKAINLLNSTHSTSVLNHFFFIFTHTFIWMQTKN